MALPATLLIACALAFAAPLSAWAIDTTITLPDTSIAHDASNADYTHRTVVGSGDSNQIVVTNTCNTLPVATNVAVDNVPWIPIAAILAAALGIVLVINRRAHIEQVSSRLRRFSGKSGAGEPPSPTSSTASIIACLVLAGGLAFSTLGSATGFAIAPSSLKVVNHIEGAFANASHAFPMEMTLYTPADAPSDADYTVSLPDGTSDTIRVTNHASAAYGFALAGDEELDIIGLPVGTVYKFEQLESGSDGLEYSQSISYTTSFVDANLTFAGNEPASTSGEASGLEHPASGVCAVGLAYSWTGTPSLEGYAFEGYSADPDATAPDAGLEYGEGKTYSYVVQDEDDVLYPVWSANTYAMAYAGMEDATPGASAPTSAAYDETFTVGTPTKTGFTFDGWDITGMDGSVHTYGASQTTAASLSGITDTSFKNLRSTAGTVTFTAQWIGPYSGSAYAVLDSDGKLTFFRSNETYTSSSYSSDTKTVRDTRGNEYTGVVFADVENTTANTSSIGWQNYRSSVRTVDVADDQAIRPQSVENWFCWCSNMTSCDLTGLDLSEATNTRRMFQGCDGLVSVDVADLDMSNITDTTEMFYQCTGLETIDVSKWDVGNVVTATKTFYNCPKIQVLDVSDWDTSSMVDMSLLFGYCKSVAVLDVSGFDTSNATNMSGMFIQCLNLASIDVTHFDTSKVNDMSSMFCGCSGFSSLDVTHFDTSKAVNMGGMFNGCSGLTDLDITNFDTSSATNMGGMFLGCSNLATIDVSRFDTSKVASMTQMFANCTGMTWLDLSNFDMSSAYNTTTNGVYLMFGGSSNLETIYAAPGTNWAAAAGATYSSSAWMFKNNNSLVGGNGTRFNDGGAAYARIDGLDGNPGYFTVSPGYTGTAYAVLTNASDSRGAGHLIFFRAATEQTAGDGQTATDVFGNSYTGTVFAGVESTEADSSSVPWYSSNSQVLDARVAPMQHIWPASTAYWFYGCSDMATVDLHGLDTSSATSMSYMFRDCSSLASINLAPLDTSNVTSMSYMFRGCSSLASINLAPLDTSNVTSMIHMFYGCSGLTSIDVSGFDTSGIESMSNMFNGCSSLTSLDLSSFNTGNVTSLTSAVRNCTNLESLDISSFDTSKVTTERYLFEGCPKLSSVKLGASFSFDGKGGITYKGILPTPDTSNPLYTGKWINTSVEGAKGVFPSDLTDNYNGSATTGNYAPGTYVWESAFTGNAYAVLDAGGKLTFFRSEAAYVDGPDQTVVDSMGNSHTGKVYSGVESTGATASSVPWHGDIASVTSVEFAQIAKPASTAHWFDGAENLTDCVLGGLVTSETSDMSSMFEGCSSLAVLDVSGLNVGALEHAERMFAGCTSLSMILAAEGADWSDGAQAPLLVSNTDMFAGCTSLEGGGGTTYDAAHQGSDYARLDGRGRAPGYFAVPLTHGIAYAVLTDANDASGTGNMVFFRSESEYSSGAGQTVSDIRGNSYSGTVFTGVESTTTTANSVPWYAEDADILSVRVAPAQTIQPAATSNWFRGQEHMTSCDLTGLDTSGTTSMSYMFNGCSALSSLDVSMLDTSHSTSFASMFSGCSGLTSLNLAGFDTQSATTFVSMFANCSGLTSLDLAGFDTRQVTSFASMFINCSSLTSVGFGCFNTSKVTTMANMFSGCTSLTSLDLGSFATPSVTTFSNMLKNCNALSSVVFGPNFNLKGKGNVASSYRLLLPTPTAESTGDNAVTGKWINSSAEGAVPVTPMQLRDNWDMTGANPSYAPGTYVWARNTDGTAVAVLDSEGTLTLLRTRTAPTPGANQAVPDLEGNVHTGTVYTGIESTASASGAAPWHADRASVLSATTASGQYVKPVSTAYWFEGCTGLNYLDFSFLDTSATTTMAHMFDGCTSLEAFEQSSSMDVSAVTDMSGMFKNCSSMTYNEIFWWDYTEALLDTSEMFYGCSALDWVDLSLDTSHATDMANMFYGCTSLEYADIGNVFTFRGANIADDSKCALLPSPPTTAPYYGTWVNTSVEGAQGVSSAQLRDNFDPTATTGDYAPGTYRWNREFLAVFDANGGTGTMSPIPLGPGAVAPANGFTPPENAVFAGWSTNANGNGTSYDVGAALPSTPGYGTAELTLYAQWLSPKSGTAYAVLDGTGKLTLFRSKKTYYAGPDQTVTDIWGNEYTGRLYTGVESTGAQSNPPWYAYRTSVTSVDIAANQIIEPANMYGWFADCTSLTTCDLDGIDTSNVTTMSKLFYNCRSLTQPDLGELDTSSVVNMSSMFYNCVAVPTENFDVSGFDTANVTDMSYMFYVAGNGYSPAVTYLDVSHFNTAKVTTMQNMFAWQQNLTSLDVSHFNTANIMNFAGMFSFCIHVDALDVSHFNTAKATAMDYMFSDCALVTSLSVANFDTSNVENLASMFQGCSNLSTLNLSNFNTAKTTNMARMFHGCLRLPSVDVSHFDTSKVTDMAGMFEYCRMLQSLDVSHFNTGNVTDMSHMFGECKLLPSLDVSHFNTGNVTNMTGMFADCQVLTSLDVSHFDTSNVTLMGLSIGQSGYYLYGMFQGCNALTALDVSNFNTSKVTSMSGMFSQCAALTEVDISGFDISSLTNAYGMFESSHNLETIYVSPDADWSASSTLTSSAEMFRYCPDLIGGNGTPYNSSYTDKSYARVDKPGQPGYFTTGPRGGTAYAVLDGNGKLTLFRSAEAYSEGAGQTVSDIRGNVYQGEVFANVEKGSFGTRWAARRASIISVDVADNQIIAPDRTNEWFYGCTNMTSCDLRGLDTSNASSMSSMFYNCTSLATLDLSGLDTSNVEGMRYMFNNCTSLESLGVSGWNTSNVTDMCGMFGNCYSLGSGFDVSGWDVSRVSDMSQMFDGCHNASFNPDVSRWKTSSATLMSYMFRNCYGAAFAPDVSKWDTSKVTNMWYMFRNCYGAAFAPDVSKWTTTSVTDMRYMFAGCSGAAFNPDVSKWATASVTSMESMFSGCSGAAFNPDVSGWDVSGASNMGNMFSGCNGAAFAPDVSEWRTSSATVMSGLFQNCNTATFNPDVSDWDVSKVTNMSAMFAGCSGAAFNPDVSHWNTSSVVSMSSMFHSCNGATFDPDVSGWNTSSVQNMYMMFAFCYGASFSPDVSGWNTSSVTNMFEMFTWCKGASFTSIDLLGWDVSNVADMQQMFASCDNLKTIFVGLGTDWSTSPALSSDYGMFENDTNLVGMNGTMFTYSHVDKSYARVDKPGQPGYFTASPSAGYAYAVLDSSGNLVMFRSPTILTTGTIQNVTDIYGNAYTGTIIGEIEDDPATSSSSSWRPFSSYSSNIKTVDVADGQVIHLGASRAYMLFEDCSNMTTCDLRGLDTSNCTTMADMFWKCSNLLTVDVSGFDTSKVTSMDQMFCQCPNLQNVDVSNFNLSSCKNISRFFYWDTGLTTASASTLEGWDTAGVTDMSEVFMSCYAITALDLSGWNTSSATDMNDMFNACSALASLDVSGFDVSHVTNMSGMFAQTKIQELDVSSFALPATVNIDGIFYQCSELVTIYAAANADWSSVSTPDNQIMFSGCSKLVGEAGSTYEYGRTTKAYAKIDGGQSSPGYFTVVGHAPYVAPEPQPTDGIAYAIFNNGGSLTFIRSYHTYTTGLYGGQDIVDIYGNHYEGEAFSGIESCDGTQNGVPWKNYRSFIESVDIADNQTISPTNTGYWFYNCSYLRTADLTGLDMSHCTGTINMFGNCEDSNFNLIGYEDWTMSSVTDMSAMFARVKLTAIDISKWDVSNVESTIAMFSYCSNLTTIYAAPGFDWSTSGKLTTSERMFGGCTNLVGGNRTAYSQSKIDAQRAVIDGLNGKQGYFTAKP